MGKRITDVTSGEFNELFTSFEHTAYRLETLQRYDVSYEEEPFAAFLNGQPQPADPSKDEWLSMIMSAVAAGKSFRRVHLVSEPLTDYLRYEIGCSYAPNAEAGEDIRILPGEPGALGLPDHDYWLFDSRDLWVMSYDSDGRFLYAELTEDPTTIVEHNYWRDKALSLAVPYADYTSRAAARRHAT
jgi:hypothetical protein